MAQKLQNILVDNRIQNYIICFIHNVFIKNVKSNLQNINVSVLKNKIDVDHQFS